MDIKGKHLKDLTVDEFKSVVSEIVSLKSTCDISLKTWLSNKEVCIYTSLGKDTILKARESAQLPFIVVMGRILYERVCVDAWIKKQARYTKLVTKRISKNK